MKGGYKLKIVNIIVCVGGNTNFGKEDRFRDHFVRADEKYETKK